MSELLNSGGEWLEINQGRLFWQPQFLSEQQAEEYYLVLSRELNWRQEHIRMFGRDVLQPRLQAWCGDKPYTYSGLTMAPDPWTPSLSLIRNACEQTAQTQFNTVLANLYRNGNDYMGWHSDNEKELGDQPVIASVSFGGTRRFVLKHRESKEKVELELTSGSLLIMAGEFQTYWQHSVPKTKKPVAPRINLTFRNIK